MTTRRGRADPSWAATDTPIERVHAAGDLTAFHWTGWFGLAGVAFLAIEILLWTFPGGSPTSMSDGAGWSRHLADIRVIALTRIMLDLAMYVSLMVFFAGFRHLIVKTKAEFEWVGSLALVAGAVWGGSRSSRTASRAPQ